MTEVTEMFSLYDLLQNCAALFSAKLTRIIYDTKSDVFFYILDIAEIINAFK